MQHSLKQCQSDEWIHRYIDTQTHFSSMKLLLFVYLRKPVIRAVSKSVMARWGLSFKFHDLRWSLFVKKQNVIKILSYCVEMWLNNSKFQVIFSEVRVTTLKLWDKKDFITKAVFFFVVFKKIVDHFKYKLFKCVVVCWFFLVKLTGDSVYSEGSQAQKKFGNIFISKISKIFHLKWNEAKVQSCI